MAISKKKKDGTGRVWVDKKGNEIPYYYVSKEDRKRDKLTRDVFRQVDKLHQEVLERKEEIVHLINEYLEDVAEQYGEDWKGNATIRDFSDIRKIEVSINERTEFDEKLQVAKAKIDSCINDWARGSSQKIKLLVDKAFRVDKKGRVDKRMLLGLRSLNIDDETWQEAMDIISDSVTIVDTKAYYRFFEREDNRDQYSPVELNFSSVKVED